jgi:hypothetical protein
MLNLIFVEIAVAHNWYNYPWNIIYRYTVKKERNMYIYIYIFILILFKLKKENTVKKAIDTNKCSPGRAKEKTKDGDIMLCLFEKKKKRISLILFVGFVEI